MTTDLLPETISGTLTREFLAAMRDSHCRSIVARHDPQRLDYPNLSYSPRHTGKMVAFIETNVHGTSGETMIEFDLPSRIQSYRESGEATADSRPWISAFAHLATYAESEMHALTELVLRPGDLLSLVWLEENNNDNLRDVRFHRDECKLVVERGKHLARFSIDTSVGPDNTARMVRRHYDKPY